MMVDEGNVLDTLQIVIKGDSTDAVGKLNSLIQTLSSMKSVTQGSNKILNSVKNNIDKISNATKSLEGGTVDKLINITNAIEGLGNLNTVKISSTIPKRITEIGEAVNTVDIDRLQQITTALGGLRDIGAINIPRMPSAANETPTIETPAPTVSEAFDGTVEIPSTIVPAEVDPSTTGAIEEQTQAVEAETESLNRNSQTWQKLKRIASNSLKGIGKIAASAANGIGKFTKSLALAPVRKFTNSIKNVKSSIGNLQKVIKKRVLYRLINAVISTITNGFKEGTSNIYQYSKAVGTSFAPNMDKLSTSVLYLKNSLGSLSAPLINAVTPAIEFLIDKFVSLINIISLTIAKLTGASSWSKAVKYATTYADAADSATAANKKLKESTLGIDELNKLTDNSNSDSGKSGSNLDTSKMFEEVPISDNSTLGDIFEPIKKSWEKNVAPLKSKAENAISKIKGLIAEISKSFKEVWTNGTGETTFDNIYETIGGIIDIAGNLGEKLKEAWNYNDNGTKQLQSVCNIFNDILGFINEIITSTAEWVSTINLIPMSNSITDFLSNLETSISDILDIFSFFNSEVLQPLATWVIEDAAPASVEVLASALGSAHDALITLKDSLQPLKEALEPVVSFIGEEFIDALDFLKRKFDEVSLFFRENGDDINEVIKSIASIFSWLWSVLCPLVKGIGKVIKEVVKVTSGIINTELSGTIGQLSGVLKIIEGLLTFDLSKILEGVLKIVESTIEKWKDRLQSLVNILVSVFNCASHIIQGILNGIIGMINKIHFSFPDWIPVIGGKEWSPNISEIKWTDIPTPTLFTEASSTTNISSSRGIGGSFATGGFPEIGQLFIANEAGPELVGNIGNRPAVANQEQIVDSVADGVADANREQNSILREGVELLRMLVEKDNGSPHSMNYYAEASRINRRDGRTIIPLGT